MRFHELALKLQSNSSTTMVFLADHNLVVNNKEETRFTSWACLICRVISLDSSAKISDILVGYHVETLYTSLEKEIVKKVESEG